MPYVRMNRVEAGPYSLRFRPLGVTGKPAEQFVQVQIGDEIFVDDEYLDYFLNYEHPCEDGVRKRIFSIPEAGTKVDLQLQQERLSGSLDKMFDAIEVQLKDRGIEIDLSEARGMVPSPDEEERAVLRVVRCASCSEKVRVSERQKACPHCGGEVRGEQGVITTEQLPAQDLVCPHEGCSFVAKIGPRAQQSLSMHIRRMHNGEWPS